MSLWDNFVVLYKKTSKSYHKSVLKGGLLSIGPWAALLNTQHARANLQVHAHTNGFQCTRCLAAWGSVNIRTHNQWEPFKVLQMFTTKCPVLWSDCCASKGSSSSRNSYQWYPVWRAAHPPGSLCSAHLVNISLSIPFGMTTLAAPQEKLSTLRSFVNYFWAFQFDAECFHC